MSASSHDEIGNCDIATLKIQTDGALAAYYGGNDQALENTLKSMKKDLQLCRPNK